MSALHRAKHSASAALDGEGGPFKKEGAPRKGGGVNIVVMNSQHSKVAARALRGKGAFPALMQPPAISMSWCGHIWASQRQGKTGGEEKGLWPMTWEQCTPIFRGCRMSAPACSTSRGDRRRRTERMVKRQVMTMQTRLAACTALLSGWLPYTATRDQISVRPYAVSRALCIANTPACTGPLNEIGLQIIREGSEME